MKLIAGALITAVLLFVTPDNLFAALKKRRPSRGGFIF
jgi:hypothetical protein